MTHEDVFDFIHRELGMNLKNYEKSTLERLCKAKLPKYEKLQFISVVIASKFPSSRKNDFSEDIFFVYRKLYDYNENLQRRKGNDLQNQTKGA